MDLSSDRWFRAFRLALETFIFWIWSEQETVHLCFFKHVAVIVPLGTIKVFCLGSPSLFFLFHRISLTLPYVRAHVCVRVFVCVWCRKSLPMSCVGSSTNIWIHVNHLLVSWVNMSPEIKSNFGHHGDTIWVLHLWMKTKRWKTEWNTDEDRLRHLLLVTGCKMLPTGNIKDVKWLKIGEHSRYLKTSERIYWWTIAAPWYLL